MHGYSYATPRQDTSHCMVAKPHNNSVCLTVASVISFRICPLRVAAVVRLLCWLSPTCGVLCRRLRLHAFFIEIRLSQGLVPITMMDKSITINTSANGYYKQQVVHINYVPISRWLLRFVSILHRAVFNYAGGLVTAASVGQFNGYIQVIHNPPSDIVRVHGPQYHLSHGLEELCLSKCL